MKASKLVCAQDIAMAAADMIAALTIFFFVLQPHLAALVS